jgi:DNA polymerase I-like protein with 3'-5' exonuclease and polymerase domains
MLLSLIELMRILPQGEAQIVGTVHDSILFLIKDTALSWALPTIRDVMEDMSLVRQKFGTDMTVPIAVEIKYGSHWGGSKVWIPSV